jgi:hypothetical protein
MEALAAGQLDANCQTLNDTVSFVGDAVNGEVVVLVNDNSAGNDKIIAAEEIQSIPELEGKEVAVEAGVVDDFLLTLALEEEGMSRSDVNIVDLETGAAAAAFAAGKVDAVGFFNVLMIMDAVKFVPKELIETTYTLGGLRWQVLLQVITPYVIPNIIDAFRINIATSWNLVIVAELVAAEQGLGKRILLAQKFLNMDEIFACLIVLSLIGFLIDLSFRGLLRVSCKWAL